jgi:4'-phosphopantetheinyl transferase
MRTAEAAIAVLAARVLLRYSLAERRGCDLGSLTLHRNASGRPVLGPENGPENGISADGFNLSHCPGAAACAVLQTAPGEGGRWQVGIDVEAVNARRPIGAMAERAFHRRECQRLFGQGDGPDLATDFTRIWTLKEAITKAVGLGLDVDFSSFCIDTAPPRLLETLPVLGDAALWRCGGGALPPLANLPAPLWAWAVRSPQPLAPLQLSVRLWPGLDDLLRALAAFLLE